MEDELAAAHRNTACPAAGNSGEKKVQSLTGRATGWQSMELHEINDTFKDWKMSKNKQHTLAQCWREAGWLKKEIAVWTQTLSKVSFITTTWICFLGNQLLVIIFWLYRRQHHQLFQKATDSTSFECFNTELQCRINCSAVLTDGIS